MRLFNHVLLLGAIVLLTNFQGTDSFTIGHNPIVKADGHDSLETTTDLNLDSMEHDQNTTSTEDDLDIHDNSSEVNKRLIKRDSQPDSIVDSNSREKLPIEDDRIDSVENLKNQTSNEDLDITNDSLETKNRLIKRNILVTSSLNQDRGQWAINGQRFDFDSTENLADISEEMQSTTPDYDLFDDLVDSMELNHKSTEDLIDANDNSSFEKDLLKGVALPATVSVFDHLPVIGVFSHPASDDLYIAKQYRGDYYIWEMEDEAAVKYFAQPAKGIPKFDLDSPQKVNSAQFIEFTPVRYLPDQRITPVL